MEHNFANWELTQLLPKTNPNHTEYSWYNKGNGVFLKSSDDAWSENQEYLEPKYEYNRDAWTWEDVRLYFTKR